eukprot:gene3970-13094_t
MTQSPRSLRLRDMAAAAGAAALRSTVPLLEELEVHEKSLSTTDGSAVVELSLRPSGSPVVCISFKNVCSASVTVRVRGKDGTAWKAALVDKVLMPSPHCEDGSQGLVVSSISISISILNQITTIVLPASSFLDVEACKAVAEIQLILRQPSPHWVRFGLQDIRCYTTMDDGGGSKGDRHSSTATGGGGTGGGGVGEAAAATTDTTKTSTPSTELEWIFAIAQQVARASMVTAPGSFEVDGRYEIP